MKRATREAPKPRGLPLLGSSVGATKDPCRFFARCHAECGPVFRVSYPGRTLTLMAGLEANRFFALEGTRVFSARRTYARVTRELGTEAYPNAHDGEAHRELRQLLAPGLSAMAIEPFLPRVLSTVRERALSWREGSVSSLSSALSPLVMDVVSLCTTGREAGERLSRDVGLYATLMGVVGVGGVLPEAALYLPPVRSARRRFAAFVAEALEDHRAMPPGLHREPDLLDALLAAESAAPGRYDAAALLALAMLPMKNAGIYLYRMVSFVFYELLRRPGLLEAVTAEVDGAFARGTPGLGELRALSTLDGVILEALRLYPMAIALPRVVAAPFEFGGFAFEEGETVYVAGPVTHFDPALFRDPEAFEPHRHSPARSEARRPHVFAPFGLGPHACAARGYSQAVAAAVVAGVLREVRLELSPPGYVARVRALPVPIPEARFRFRVGGRRAAHAEAAPAPGVREGLSAALWGLSPGRREEVLSDLALRSVAAGEVVFRQGDASDRIYVVRSGEVEVLLEEPGAEPRPVARLGPGEPFGEIGLLQGVPRTATVRATTRSTLLSLGREAFHALAVEGDLTRQELVQVMERRASVSNLARALPQMDAEALARLAGTCASRSFGAGEEIVRQGDPPDRFYVLTRGTVEVVLRPEGGSEFVVAELCAVDFFGEVGLLEGRPRTATVRAAGPVTVLEVPGERFVELVAGSEGAREDLARTAAERLLGLAAAAGS